MLQSTNPGRLSNKEGLRGGEGMHESTWEGKIEEMPWVDWGVVVTGAGGIRYGEDGGRENGSAGGDS